MQYSYLSIPDSIVNKCMQHSCTHGHIRTDMPHKRSKIKRLFIYYIYIYWKYFIVHFFIIALFHNVFTRDSVCMIQMHNKCIDFPNYFSHIFFDCYEKIKLENN